MRKIFGYELRRAVCSKFFAGLLAVCLWFGWQTLNSAVIQGVAHTAPFSPWSFGYYLAQVLPLLSVALLFFLWGVFSKEARQVGALTAATPTDPGKYLLVKCGASAAAWLLLTLCVTGLGAGFLICLFGAAVPVGEWLLAALFSLLPALTLVLGLGMMAGRSHPALLFVLMPLMLAVNFLPGIWSLFGAAFFSEYPLSLDVLDPSLTVSAGAVIVKMVCTAIGAAAIAFTVYQEKKHP